MDGVNDSVSFVDNSITVKTAEVRDRDIPLEQLLVSVGVNIHTSVAESMFNKYLDIYPIAHHPLGLQCNRCMRT